VCEVYKYIPNYLNAYLVEMRHGQLKDLYAVYAQTIETAIETAIAFGQMYRGFSQAVLSQLDKQRPLYHKRAWFRRRVL